MDLAQRGAHARVEAACGDVDVLGFDFELGAAPVSGTGFNAIKECPADAPSSIFRADANVPQAREVFTPFAVVQAIDVKCDDRPADSLVLPECAQEYPVRKVPRFPGPALGAVGLVVVLDIGRLNGFFDQPDSPRPSSTCSTRKRLFTSKAIEPLPYSERISAVSS